ncbi:gamma-glutamyltransferase family protein [Pseudonocardia sp. CA-107938]|uniref:gamma-glutamyltransferase family protein n=1 Tax=Pseudonocardia sp. CA-107938 TaxID=3240021 RepID=UPI003D91CF53
MTARRPKVLLAVLLLASFLVACSAPTAPTTPSDGPCTASAATGPGGRSPGGGVPGAPEIATGYRSGMTTVHTRTYAVVTANPLASQAACEVLAAGGTAVDAAIAGQLVLGLVEPQSSGVGGGGFLLSYDAASGRIQSYDGRETAPAAADGNYLNRVSASDTTPPKPSARASGRSIGVPGVMRMLELAHRDHGRTAWRDLFTSATTLARDGFTVSPRLAASIAAEHDGLAADPATRGYFLHPDGSPITAGETLRNPALADTYAALAERGADALHTGPIAQAILAAAADTTGGRTPSLLTGADLAGYRPVERKAACGPYRELQVCSMAPPSSGGIIVLATLGILARVHIDAEKPEPAGPDGAVPTPRAVHLIAEAERLAYADRDRYVADTDFVPLPGGTPESKLLDGTYLDGRAAMVKPQGSLGKAPAGDLGAVPVGNGPEGPEHGTSHLSIVDSYGNAVSFTTSVESAFGAYHMAGGFVLNNQLTDFAAQPLDDKGVPVANRVQPGKRPRSSMAPTIVTTTGTKPELRYVTGSPGGSQIPQFVVKTLVNALDWGQDPQAAVSAPDVGATNSPVTGVGGEHPDIGEAADGANDALVTGLRALGHQVSVAAQSSGLSLLERTPDGWAGGADPRREGVVLGDRNP